ncbi:MAG: fructose-6-phosphate aldolase [Sphaerochaetaceae bacterium]
MDLLLDSADLSAISHALQHYPLKGVTTNPSMLSRIEGGSVLSCLQSIRKMIGDTRDLHVQVMGCDESSMIKEAHRLVSLLGEQTFIAVPVTETGLKVIKQLASEGIAVTATTVFSTMQGILAMLSGARYIAVFYDRMLNLDIDAKRVIKELSGFLWTNTSATQVLAASFRNVSEVTSAYANGAGVCTVRPELLSTGLSMPSISQAVEDFTKDWKAVYGEKTLLDL